MKASHSTLLVLSGLVWLSIGLMLLTMGVSFIYQADIDPNIRAVLIISFLLIGKLKGIFVLRKAAQKSFDRIRQLPNPTSITNIYTKGNLAIIAVMMLFGMGLKFFEVPYFIRGPIDIAVGLALVEGALQYFTCAISAKKIA